MRYEDITSTSSYCLLHFLLNIQNISILAYSPMKKRKTVGNGMSIAFFLGVRNSKANGKAIISEYGMAR